MTLPDYAMNASSFPELYERCLVGPLFRPWADALLQRAAPAAGESVLDVACGTGIVARLAKARLGSSAHVVGVDVSPNMLTVAAAADTGVEWRQGTADALPVAESESFDIVVCQQGLQFFADRPAAVREMRRALTPAGRLAAAVWTSLEDNPFLLALHRVAEREIGPITDRRHGFGDRAALQRLLEDAGFQNVNVETMTRTMHFPDGAVFVRLNAMALVGMSDRSPAMNDEERAAAAALVTQACAEVLPPSADGRALSFEIGANLATAVND